MVMDFVARAGEAGLLFWRSIASLTRGPWYVRNWFLQMLEIGNRSMPVVVVTAVFSGAVFALQVWQGFEQFGATTLVAFATALAMTRELVPVLAALMVAGRAGSAMAAEIGTMVVTEQVDALETLAVEPIKWLVVPRVIASAVMLPVLVVIGDLLGILGGYTVAVRMLGARPTPYWEASFAYITLDDVASGLVKAALFGVMIAVFSCARGFDTRGGAQGVGRATTGAVVTSSMAILISDFFLTRALMSLWDM
jgi:phospholipid/cholesterol/gamma-HCH transport system permease protein